MRSRSTPPPPRTAIVDPHTCTIDGFGPVPLMRPSSVAGLGELVRGAAAEGQAVYPGGGHTGFGIGLPPTRPGGAVDLRQLADVIHSPARDLSITAQAGLILDKLQELLAKENQRPPVDVPPAARATMSA